MCDPLDEYTLNFRQAILYSCRVWRSIRHIGTARASFGKLAIALSTDLTANRVAYAVIFNKPARTAMTVNANGTWGDQLEIASVSLKLSDLELTASRAFGQRRATP